MKMTSRLDFQRCLSSNDRLEGKKELEGVNERLDHLLRVRNV